MPGPIHLGPFLLQEPIAKGGMGSVWRAVHGDGLKVAVKVIAGEGAKQEKYLASFRNEVRNAASLDHPSICTVLDHGKVDAVAASASAGQLTEGSPYLAMEYASGGSLAGHRHGLTWPETKAILLTLLDALAHAHARNVIHRDLKAGNVLLCTDQDSRPGLKLTDFGIAHAMDVKGMTGVMGGAAGTLHYMAPEQLLGRWRDYGPATDLYALGCLTYRLASGKVPFTGLKGPGLLRAQLYQDPPELRAVHPMPDGFAEWVGNLMKKDPLARFQRAADAAWQLLDLRDPTQEASRPPAFDIQSAVSRADPFLTPNELADEEGPTAIGEFETGELSTLLSDPSLLSVVADEPPTSVGEDSIAARLREDESSLFDEGFRPPEPPPMPSTWRRPVPPARPIPLVGAGLGLYGLRAITMVGRHRERNALWEALKHVRRTGVAHYVQVRGAAGLGKTTLVNWLCERSHELGAAGILRLTHDANDGPGEGLRRMVTRALRCKRLDRADVMERVEDFLNARGCDDEDEILALTELISPAPEGEGRARTVRLETEAERLVVVRRFMERCASFRPLIAWFDDVQYGPDAVAFTEQLLLAQAMSPSAILVVHAVRDEALGDDGIAERLDELLAQPNTEQLQLDPLSSRETQDLVRDLLGLDESLAIRVEQRCAGNPAFAVELVGDWVGRGVLELGDAGFELRQGEDALLPDDLHTIWSGRVEQLLEGLQPIAGHYLERAAALGLSVNEAEWQEACDDPEGDLGAEVGGGNRVALSMEGLRARADLLDRLLSSSLVEERDDGWTFAHGMLRESLVRTARESGRWKDHNRACASMLVRKGVQHADERVGRHLVAAGRLEDAIEPLMRGVSRTWESRGARPALALLQTCERVMNRLQLDGSDPRWGDLWVLRARLHCFHGDPIQADDSATAAVTSARAHGWDEVLPKALFERARAALAARRYRDAEDLLKRVNELAATSQDLDLLGMSFLLLGECSGHSRDIDEARRLLEAARRCFQQTGDQVMVSTALTRLGTLERRTGSKKRAWELLTRAAKLAKRTGSRDGLGIALKERAEILRIAGELDRAKNEYKKALSLFNSTGAAEASGTRLDIGLVYLLQGKWAPARQVIEETRQNLERQERPHLLGAAHILLAPCCAIAGEWANYDRHFELGSRLLEQTGFHDNDTGRIALLAGEMAERAGFHKRALAAYELSLDQYRGAGDYEGATPVTHALNRIEALMQG